MACIAKRRGRYVIDFYDTYGKRRWITMPKGTTKKKAMEKLREIEDQLRRGIFIPEKRIACPPSALDLVFPNEAGNPINHSNMLVRHFFPALKKAGIKRIRFHDLRHTYASLLIEQGENIKYIQSQLGHSSPMVTLNVYAHLMKPVNQESPARLEDSIFKTNGSKTVAKTKKGVGV